MPITFNVSTLAFEGENLSGETLAGFDFSVFGGLIQNSGTISGAVTANSDLGIEIINSFGASLSKGPGSRFAVDLLGNGGRILSNDGTIFGEVRFGNGWDSFFNSGLVTGQIKLGNGNDLLINQIIPAADGGETAGTITNGVFMGAGDDTVINAGKMANVLLGGGNDRYVATDTTGTSGLPDGIAGDVRGQSGNDQLIGGSGKDRFFGGSDNDQLIGNGGNDKLYGQAGNDFILAGDGNDLAAGGDGNDYLDGGANNDRLFGANGKDTIFAGSGNDTANGGNDDDLIYGDSGNDLLIGGAGNDTLSGGAGRDTMSGGAGADEFVFGANSGQDLIRDFESGDTINILLPLVGLEGYAQILAHTEFSGANAVIDLSGLFNAAIGSLTPFNGSELTIRGVTIDDLTPDTFGLFPDVITVG